MGIQPWLRNGAPTVELINLWVLIGNGHKPHDFLAAEFLLPNGLNGLSTVIFKLGTLCRTWIRIYNKISRLFYVQNLPSNQWSNLSSTPPGPLREKLKGRLARLSARWSLMVLRYWPLRLISMAMSGTLIGATYHDPRAKFSGNMPRKIWLQMVLTYLHGKFRKVPLIILSCPWPMDFAESVTFNFPMVNRVYW
jgi:hypothetical protein